MEFLFNCERAVNANKEGYAIIDSTNLKGNSKLSNISQIIDTLGQLSAKSQALKAVITTTSKMLLGDTKIYIKVEENKAIGFIKVGKKNLFIHDAIGKISEISPLCVLDFYVHESVQRSGYGRVFF